MGSAVPAKATQISGKGQRSNNNNTILKGKKGKKKERKRERKKEEEEAFCSLVVTRILQGRQLQSQNTFSMLDKFSPLLHSPKRIALGKRHTYIKGDNNRDVKMIFQVSFVMVVALGTGLRCEFALLSVMIMKIKLWLVCLMVKSHSCLIAERENSNSTRKH